MALFGAIIPDCERRHVNGGLWEKQKGFWLESLKPRPPPINTMIANMFDEYCNNWAFHWSRFKDTLGVKLWITYGRRWVSELSTEFPSGKFKTSQKVLKCKLYWFSLVFFEPCGNQSGVMVAGRPRQSIGGGRVPQNQHQLWPKLHHIIDFKPHLQLFLHHHPLNLDCGGKNSI